MKTQIKKKISLFLLFCFMILISIPYDRAEINCSLNLNYHFNDQQIEIVVKNNEYGDITRTITGFTITSSTSGLGMYAGIYNPIEYFGPPIAIIEPGESFTLIIDLSVFSVKHGGKIFVKIAFLSGDRMNGEVIAGFREDFIFNGTIISIVLGVIAVVYNTKIKPNKKIT